MITILAVSDGYKHFAEAMREYEKRTQKFVTIKTLKPISHTEIEYIRVKETLAIQEALKKLRGHIILLDERGKGMNTLDFSELIQKKRDASEDIIFILGGSYGVDLELFATTPHTTLRISDFVMPHSLAFLVLLEQVYRAYEIMKGSGYHHA